MIELLLGLGSNLKPAQNLQFALESLQSLVTIQKRSRCYESYALDGESPNYLNLVLHGETDLPFEVLKSGLNRIERIAGRQAKSKTCALDIDILTYGRFVGFQGNCQLPRPELTEHAHVLCPVAEMLPKETHPLLGETYSALWSQRKSEILRTQKLWPAQNLLF